MGRDARDMRFVDFVIVILIGVWKCGQEEIHISCLILGGRRGNEGNVEAAEF
jgi:hypothetical protein